MHVLLRSFGVRIVRACVRTLMQLITKGVSRAVTSRPTWVSVRRKKPDEGGRQRSAVPWRCSCLRVVVPRTVQETRELWSVRTCWEFFLAEGNRRFHPAAAGQKSDEERLDFLVLRRYVRALSLCLLDFEHLIVTLDETFLYRADCNFTSACAHLSGLTASLLAQNVGHPATRPAEALARGSGGQRPIPWAGVDRPRCHALQDSMETRHETYAAARGRGHHI